LALHSLTEALETAVCTRTELSATRRSLTSDSSDTYSHRHALAQSHEYQLRYDTNHKCQYYITMCSKADGSQLSLPYITKNKLKSKLIQKLKIQKVMSMGKQK